MRFVHTFHNIFGFLEFFIVKFTSSHLGVETTTPRRPPNLLKKAQKENRDKRKKKTIPLSLLVN
jgi:hypothetical protein